MGTILKDIDIAKQLLDIENLSICIVKDGEVIFRSSEKGIRPAYTIAKTDFKKLKDSSVADRIIGKATAIIFKKIGFRRIFTKVISEKAMDILFEEQIYYDKIVDHILNRKKTDLCPVEILSLDIEDFDTLIEKLDVFLKNVKVVKRK